MRSDLAPEDAVIGIDLTGEHIELVRQVVLSDIRERDERDERFEFTDVVSIGERVAAGRRCSGSILARGGVVAVARAHQPVGDLLGVEAEAACFLAPWRRERVCSRRGARTPHRNDRTVHPREARDITHVQEEIRSRSGHEVSLRRIGDIAVMSLISLLIAQQRRGTGSSHNG